MKWVASFGLFFVFSLIFISGIVSAISGVCSSSQTIMKIASNSNAHGGLWDSSGGIKVCYTDFFSQPYNGTNPHDCDSNDIVLKLSNASNAHAAEKSSSSYPLDVCYKGLSDCTIESGGCPSGKAAIAYISGTSNAHLWGVGWLPIPPSSYSAVCCKGKSDIITPTVGVGACYQLDQDSCNNENGAVASLDPGCNGQSSCICEWANDTSKCMLKWNVFSSDPNCEYKCVISSSEQTECSGGSQILSLIATITSVSLDANCASNLPPAEASGCKSSSATIACGSLEANLPFFGIEQFMLSLISIAIAYALFSRKKLL